MTGNNATFILLTVWVLLA